MCVMERTTVFSYFECKPICVMCANKNYIISSNTYVNRDSMCY